MCVCVFVSSFEEIGRYSIIIIIRRYHNYPSFEQKRLGRQTTAHAYFAAVHTRKMVVSNSVAAVHTKKFVVSESVAALRPVTCT